MLNEKYRVVCKIGEGGMGEVYLGRNIHLNIDVAIKILIRKPTGNPEYIKRFLREIRHLSYLNHPNIVKLLDVDRTEDGNFFIVMEYIDGRTLTEEVEKVGIIKEERLINIAIGLCKALSEAHNKGIIHRDLKPENVMLVDYTSEKDFVKVLDFGLSKIIKSQKVESTVTRVGDIIGSPYFMSPEQITDAFADELSDIYSLGLTLYYCLTGELPYKDKSLIEVIKRQTDENSLKLPNQIKISKPFRNIINAMIDKKRDNRPQAVSEILDYLRILNTYNQISKIIEERFFGFDVFLQKGESGKSLEKFKEPTVTVKINTDEINKPQKS